MKNKRIIHKILTFLIAAIWLINGLFCKVLNLVPRHRQIVAKILGENHSILLTEVIGIAEILMAVWIVSSIKPQINAISQICIVAIMNAMEFFLVPDLLLWGKLNALFAFLFILLIYFNAFILNKKSVHRA